MATHKIRGSSHNVIFPYKTETGETKQQWESYAIELEAVTRQAYIKYLQNTKDIVGLQAAVNEYKQKKLFEKLQKESIIEDTSPDLVAPSGKKNLHRTYRDFAQKWLPFHARKKRFSPKTYDSYLSNMENHISPFEPVYAG